MLQDLVQDLASLARKILARFAYFLQDGFYWVELDGDTDKEYKTSDGEQNNGKAIDGNGNQASMESGAKESDNSNDTEQQNDKAIDGMGNEASMESGAKESDNSNDGEHKTMVKPLMIGAARTVWKVEL